MWLGALAIVANPYGPGLLWSGWDNIKNVHADINEWEPVLDYLGEASKLTARTMICAFSPFVALFAVGGVGVFRVLRRRMTSEEGLGWLTLGGVPLGMMAVSLVAVRFVYLATAPLMWLAALCDWRGTRMRLLAVTGTAALVAVTYQSTVVGRPGGLVSIVENLGENVAPGRFPDAAVEVRVGPGFRGGSFLSRTGVAICSGSRGLLMGVSADGRQNASVFLSVWADSGGLAGHVRERWRAAGEGL